MEISYSSTHTANFLQKKKIRRGSKIAKDFTISLFGGKPHLCHLNSMGFGVISGTSLCLSFLIVWYLSALLKAAI